MASWVSWRENVSTKVTQDRQLLNKVSILTNVIMIRPTLQQATQEYTPIVYMDIWAARCKIQMKI